MLSAILLPPPPPLPVFFFSLILVNYQIACVGGRCGVLALHRKLKERRPNSGGDRRGVEKESTLAWDNIQIFA